MAAETQLSKLYLEFSDLYINFDKSLRKGINETASGLQSNISLNFSAISKNMIPPSHVSGNNLHFFEKNLDYLRKITSDVRSMQFNDKSKDMYSYPTPLSMRSSVSNPSLQTFGGSVNAMSPKPTPACSNLDMLLHDLNEFQIQQNLNQLPSTPPPDNMNRRNRPSPSGGAAARPQGRAAPTPSANDSNKCAACGEQISDQLVTALGKSWHYSHFVCTGCKSELARQNFYERDESPYCEGCYQTAFSPKCAHCQQPILDRCITALDKPWHPEHFFCQGCTRPFDESSGFHERDGKPYCADCYNDAFAAKCAGCLKPITSNYVNALDRQWHSACFVCRDCGSDFSTGNFYEVDGQPYCELHYHARRGSICITCKEPIAGKCISAMGKKFHPEHFTCSFCNGELAKSTFLVKDDKPYCNECHLKLFNQ